LNKKIQSVVLVAAFAATTLFGYSATASQTGTYKDQTTALNSLVVKDEVRAGYVRTKFKHWVGAGNGCDSRKAVIISEAVVKPTVEKGCVIKGGEWLSIYDLVKVTEAGKLDVDHMVPLAEAWDSGASAWNDKKREMYANDQTDPRHLIAVTGASNRQKSDRDPAEWMPTNKAYTCEYITNWLSIKVRWSLTVDKKEKEAISTILKGCKATKIVVTPVA
jgi:hypothetical protein